MSLIKQHLHALQEAEEEALYAAFLEFAEENRELFQQLTSPKKEVIGYEE